LLAAACDGTQFLSAAREVVERSRDAIFAPPVLWQEFANGRYRLERRGIHTTEENDEALTWVDRLAIHRVDSERWVARALAIARRYRQPRVFDAIYFACAEDLAAEMWTCDRKFVASFGPDRPAWLKLCPDDVPADPPASS
jgi:predicted nucleic acid-binding protein